MAKNEGKLTMNKYEYKFFDLEKEIEADGVNEKEIIETLLDFLGAKGWHITEVQYSTGARYLSDTTGAQMRMLEIHCFGARKTQESE